MADISITDRLGLSADAHVSDDAPLALANLKSLNFSSLPVIGDLDKPIDRFPLDEAEIGLKLSVPEALASASKFTLAGGASASISICNHKHETLFDDDQFAPRLEIKENECWAGLSIDFNLKESIATNLGGGFGVNVSTGQDVAVATYVHFPVAGAPLPNLKDGLTAVLQNYSIPSTPEKIRAIPLGLAHTAEATGTISFGASYSAPLNITPLATLGLPLNLSLNVAPAATASVSGSIEISGTFIVRAYRSEPTKLVFGAYKKNKTALTATLSGETGIEVDVNKTDIFAKVMSAVLPKADLDDLHLDDSQSNELREALKACVDQSISLAVNTSCTASNADEAAVVYELDLSSSEMSQTDLAISSALHGDWSAFENLPTARPLRNIVRDLHDRKHKLSLNLLGIYNAASISDYVKSTTILHDEHGQIAMLDKVSAKGLSAGIAPYVAKADKLRTALAHAFVASIAYGASKDKLGITSFSIRQSLLEYHASASASDIKPEVLTARAVDLALNPQWDSILQSPGEFNHNKFYLDISYDLDQALHFFYSDVAARTPRSADSLDRIGRDTLIALLPPQAVNSQQRRNALNSDEIWNAMRKTGNTAAFKQIPGLARLEATALAAVSSDFIDICWWSDAALAVTPKLTAVLTAIEQSKSPNPLNDAAFMAAHKALENALQTVAQNTRSAFNDGWPLAVMYRLAASSGANPPSVQMDIGWNGKFEHYEGGAKVAAVQSTSA